METGLHGTGAKQVTIAAFYVFPALDQKASAGCSDGLPFHPPIWLDVDSCCVAQPYGNVLPWPEPAHMPPFSLLYHFFPPCVISHCRLQGRN